MACSSLQKNSNFVVGVAHLEHYNRIVGGIFIIAIWMGNFEFFSIHSKNEWVFLIQYFKYHPYFEKACFFPVIVARYTVMWNFGFKVLDRLFIEFRNAYLW